MQGQSSGNRTWTKGPAGLGAPQKNEITYPQGYVNDLQFARQHHNRVYRHISIYLNVFIYLNIISISLFISILFQYLYLSQYLFQYLYLSAVALAPYSRTA